MGTTTSDPLTGGLYIFDPIGDVFARLRRAGLGLPLLRAHAEDVPPTSARLAIVTMPPIPWERIAALALRLPTLVVAPRQSEDDAQRALASGAVGYLAAELRPASFRRAVRAAIDGDLVFSRQTLVARIRGRSSGEIADPWSKLTRRQREVLSLIAQGASDKEIGARLGIKPATAQKHAASLVKRLGVPNRAAAAAIAYRRET